MLTKLLKYEWKTTARVLLPIGGGVLIFTILTGLANMLLNRQSNLPDMVAFFQAMLNMIAVLVWIFLLAACVFVNVRQFYKLLGEQGYLMLSLPAATWKHMAAKLICACAWSVIGGAFLILCGCILNMSFGGMSLNAGDSMAGLQPGILAPLCLVMLFLLFLLAGTYLDFYLACGIGGQFGQQRLLASIIAYFVLGFIEQILSTVLMMMAVFAWVAADGAAWMQFLYSVDSFWATIYLLLILLAFVLVLDAIKWAITQWLMTRRLNLA